MKAGSCSGVFTSAIKRHSLTMFRKCRSMIAGAHTQRPAAFSETLGCGLMRLDTLLPTATQCMCIALSQQGTANTKHARERP